MAVDNRASPASLDAIDAQSAFERTPLAAVPTGMRSLKVGDDANEPRCIRMEMAYSSKGVSSRQPIMID